MASKGRIMVIDDEEAIRRTIQVLLEGEGHYVYTFDNAAEGAIYVWYNYEEIDLILLDLHMEATGATGEEFFKTIRSIPNPEIRRIPIIIVSAVVNKDDVMRVVRLNPEGYILKPFNSQALLRKIDECLAHLSK
ncbi:MAG: response regulator [Candidatus Poribacteria bacterium]|nr:response regulator [Candidatus Poribacteria bacterium]